jgi:hypothetical protein
MVWQPELMESEEARIRREIAGRRMYDFRTKYVWASGVQSAVPGELSHIQLVNRNSSGLSLVVFQLSLVTSTPGLTVMPVYSHGVNDTHSLGAVDIPDAAAWTDLRLSGSPPLRVRKTTSAVDLVADKPYVNRRLIETGAPRAISTPALILPAGSSVWVVCQTANAELRVAFEGYMWDDCSCAA